MATVSQASESHGINYNKVIIDFSPILEKMSCENSEVALAKAIKGIYVIVSLLEMGENSHEKINVNLLAAFRSNCSAIS